MWTYLALLAAVIAVSASAPLVHAAHPAGPLTVASLRIGLAALVLLVAAGSRLRSLARLNRRQRILVGCAGTLLGAHFAVWITSLYFTSTAASVALVATQPVFAAVLGRMFLRETIRSREAVGIAIAALGCIALAGGDAGNSRALLGDVLAILGAATAAAYLVVGRSLRAAVPLTPYLALVNLIAGASLLVVALASGAQMSGYPSSVYLAIAACALVSSIIGHTLLNWSVRRVAAHVVSLAILGEPVGASIIQWLAHGERPPPHAAIGGSIILAGIAIGFVGRRGSVAPASS